MQILLMLKGEFLMEQQLPHIFDRATKANHRDFNGLLIVIETVFVIVATFNNPLCHRLLIQNEPKTSILGGNGSGEEQLLISSSGGDDNKVKSEQLVGGEISYNIVFICEVTWAPITRPCHHQDFIEFSFSSTFLSELI